VREVDMRAIKAHFDGKSIKIPEELHQAPPGEVLIILREDWPDSGDSLPWMRAQETAFAKVWETDEDAVYDSL
jgi:hypothetical protein